MKISESLKGREGDELYCENDCVEWDVAESWGYRPRRGV
jgi:hypothetical protein